MIFFIRGVVFDETPYYKSLLVPALCSILDVDDGFHFSFSVLKVEMYR